MTPSLKHILDNLYGTYDFKGRIVHDPIEFPYRYERPEDKEVVGFISSCFSYGRVGLFKAVLEKIFGIMGDNPRDFLLGFKAEDQGALFSGIQYRFNKSDDIVSLLHILGRALEEHGSLERIFLAYYRTSDETIGGGLTGLVETLLGVDVSSVYGANIKPGGLLQFFPSPANGSACKRMNMYLRWMARDKDIDFGIWKNIPKNKLVIPLDVHIARISRCLGLTARSAQDWKTAVEITERLKKFDPADPLKYDFALCHRGIAKVCSTEHCGDCTFFSQRR